MVGNGTSVGVEVKGIISSSIVLVKGRVEVAGEAVIVSVDFVSVGDEKGIRVLVGVVV
jgi:hypothetical protein